jgi:hypothetical protein
MPRGAGDAACSHDAEPEAPVDPRRSVALQADRLRRQLAEQRRLWSGMPARAPRRSDFAGLGR